jgi:hypothetical protein
MTENINKSKEEIALELFIYLTSGYVKHGVKYERAHGFSSPFQYDENLGVEQYIGNQYLDFFKDCLKVVKDEK